MVNVFRNPNGDTRTAPKNVTFEEFQEANDMHINDVKHVMHELSQIPVRCIITGEIFESKKSVCTKYNISEYQLEKSLCKHVSINGNIFEIVKEDK